MRRTRTGPADGWAGCPRGGVLGNSGAIRPDSHRSDPRRLQVGRERYGPVPNAGIRAPLPVGAGGVSSAGPRVPTSGASRLGGPQCNRSAFQALPRSEESRRRPAPIRDAALRRFVTGARAPHADVPLSARRDGLRLPDVGSRIRGVRDPSGDARSAVGHALDPGSADPGIRGLRRRNGAPAPHPIEADEHGLSFSPPKRRIAWDEVTRFGLAYFSTRRDRARGWMELEVGSRTATLRVDSRLERFNELVDQVWSAASRLGVELDPTTRANLEALGTASRASRTGDPA